MLIATEHIGGVGVGVTAPQYFLANDNKKYVVKLQNNKLGLKVLVSEFIAAQIGQAMQLCFPPSAIIEIDENLLQQSPSLLASGANAGRHFASQYLGVTEYLTRENPVFASNISDMAGVILFDHMFHNADRSCNKRNLLLHWENQNCKIYAIDNSHLFRAGRWTVKSLRKLASNKKIYYQRHYGLLLKEFLSSDDFAPYLAALKELNDSLIDVIIGDIPHEWLPEEEERQALTQYIKIRRDLAPEIWEKLRKHIPIERGGRKGIDPRLICLTSRASAISGC